MGTKLKLLIIVPLLFSGIHGYGKEANNSETPPTTTTPTPASPPNTSKNIQDSAKKAEKKNDSAKKISQVMGVAMMGMGAINAAQCGSQNYAACAQAALFFAMGAMSFKQAKSHSKSGNGAGFTGLDTSSWDNPFGDPNAPAGTDTGNDDLGPDLSAVVNTGKFDKIKTALTTTGINGIKLDPNNGKITDSNTGKTYDANSLGTAQGMADAGFSSGDIAAAMDASKKAEKAAMKKLGVEGIGAATAENGFTDGGAGGTLSGAEGDINMGGSGLNRSLASTSIKAPSNQIAGLTKNFNGERIGVSAENIFNMMARRYKTKEKQNTFFEPSELVKMPQ